MAFGKKIAEFTDVDMVKGMSTSSDISDGGFSPETDAVNLIAQPGVVYAPAQPTDASTNLIGNIIASCENGSTAATADKFYLATTAGTADGTYYYWNSGSGLTLKRTDSTNDYTTGKSDMVCYKGEVYATSNTTIVRWVPDSVFTINFLDLTGSYGLAGSVPHPILVYIDFIYYGNGNKLLRQDTAGGTPVVILTLSSEQVIVALSIDSGSGMMLISTVNGFNLSDSLAQLNKVHYYNGSAPQPAKTVIVDDMITAFYPNGNLVYVGYGQNLGLWNGSGIQFLIKLKNVQLDNTYLLYKHHFTNIGSTVYVIDGTQILAHGPVRQNGNKVFYYAFSNSSATILTNIANQGNNILGVAFLTNKLNTFSVVTPGSNQDFFTNSWEFDDEVWIRRVRIVYKNTVNNNINPGSIRFKNQDGYIISVANGGTFLLTNTTGAASAYKDILNVDVKVQQIQAELIMSTATPGIRRIIFYGDPANIT